MTLIGIRNYRDIYPHIHQQHSSKISTKKHLNALLTVYTGRYSLANYETLGKSYQKSDSKTSAHSLVSISIQRKETLIVNDFCSYEEKPWPMIQVDFRALHNNAQANKQHDCSQRVDEVILIKTKWQHALGKTSHAEISWIFSNMSYCIFKTMIFHIRRSTSRKIIWINEAGTTQWNKKQSKQKFDGWDFYPYIQQLGWVYPWMSKCLVESIWPLCNLRIMTTMFLLSAEVFFRYRETKITSQAISQNLWTIKGKMQTNEKQTKRQLMLFYDLSETKMLS